MRPVFCGNFDYDTRQYDLERLFSKYGPISRIDIKSRYAFIYFEDERDAEDAIRRLDNVSFGYNRRRLSVQWSRQVEPAAKNRDRPTGDVKPTRTLFVINFDPIRTKIQDIERHFEPYGKISNIRVRRNFAFVQYETQEEASAAVKNTDKRMMTVREMTDTAAPSEVLMTGVAVAPPTCAHLAQGTEGITVQIMIAADAILGTIAVMEQCTKGEALSMSVMTGAEALVMIAMIGGEALVMINTSSPILKNPRKELVPRKKWQAT